MDVRNLIHLNLGMGTELATTPSNTQSPLPAQVSGTGVSAWPRGVPSTNQVNSSGEIVKPSRQDALQALLAFSALHEQVRRRRSLASQLTSRRNGAEAGQPGAEFEQGEQLVLDEVLQLVAERAVAITGANGLAIALAENNEIVLRASAGTVKPDVGTRIDRDSAFSGACFRTAQIVRCDDTENDPRVNLQVCRHLGTRSMVAVPLCGRRRVIGVLEAFSSDAFGFNESDVRSLSLLAELILGALKPEDEDRFAESAQAASAKLEPSIAVEKPAQKISPKETHEEPTAASAVVAETFTSGASVETPQVESAAPAVADPKLIAQSTDAETRKDDTSAQDAPEHDRLEDRALQDNEPPPSAAQAATQKPSSAYSRPGVLLVLALVVVAALVAAAIWWKIRNVQPGSAIMPAQSATANPAAGVIPADAQPSIASSLSTGKTASNPNAYSDELRPPQAASPANSQELAKFPRVTGIRHWSSADSSTVVLDLQDQVQYEAHRLTSPNRIYFDLHDTVLAPDLSATNIEIGDALLNRVRVAQPLPGMTRVVLETRGDSNFSVSLETNPYRLVVEIRKIGANPRSAVDLFPRTSGSEKNELAIVVPPPSKEDLQLRARVPKMRIVVDAGHGGWDLGTVGRHGLLEKDVVLEIAQRLGKLLESRLGMEVVYTRQDDSYIPLDERAEIANEAQADLFVSVHANYSDLPSARGVETYYTNFFSAPSPKDFEARDTSTGNPSGNPSPAPAALSPGDLHERIEQSRRLAACVQRSLYGTLSVENPGLRDRGIKEAGFVVLTETAMPGILAEVSFVSSPTDEQRLRSDGYREQIAEALYKGIARYAANSHVVKVASAGAK